MYLMYVDESGDCGLLNSPTRYFVLTGMVVHELRWREYLEELINFRQRLKQRFGLKLQEEFHSAKLIQKPKELQRIPRNERLAMISAFADQLSKMRELSIINVVVDKTAKPQEYDVFENAWKVLIQRFENTISRRNFPGPAHSDERGLIFCDNTDDKKLMKLARQMRRYNPVPNQPQFGAGWRNVPLSYIVEDPSFRDSAFSFFIQAVDLATFLLYQRLAPNKYMRKKGGGNYFNKLQPILCTAASNKNPEGIVYL